MEQAKKEIPAQELAKIDFAPDQYSALDGADACILVTEWKAFRQPDFKKMAALMKERVIFDGRNQYDPDEIKEAGFEYHWYRKGIGIKVFFCNVWILNLFGVRAGFVVM